MALSQHGINLRLSARAHVPLLKRWSLRVRSRHLFVMDSIGLLLAAVAAILLWKDQPLDLGLLTALAWVVGILVFSQIALNILLGLYTTSWRFASINEMWRVLGITFAGSVAAVILVRGIVLLAPPATADMPPASFWLLEAMFTLFVLAGPRFLIRAISELSEQVDEPAERHHTLLYGAGWAGVMIARSAERSPESGVLPVGFLDDNADLRGRRVAGLPVYGDVSAMARAKRATGASALLITMPRATGSNVRRVVDAAIHHGLDVRTVPSVTDLIDGTIDAKQTRRVRVEDLLRRPPATEHSPELKQLLASRTVMVTGAAGSIGSELVRQVLALEPARVVMVDQAESALYMVARDLERRSQVMQGLTEITTHLQDVTDRDAMSRLMRETRPVIVFHAAAYKHVPMLEDHPSQAVRVNIGGTTSVVEAAIENGVERFVLVSTDKAVRPSSVMGATKRIAEMIVSDAARRTGHAYVSVRFGNVLGSNGSVIPVFQSQLENGHPLTVTDPEMTRYFMTIPEASWLILDAAAMSESGCLYVLDMGQPVRVMDLATDLIRLSGRNPDSVPFTFTGLRPGEKLHEELFYADEDVTPTDVPKVLRSAAVQQPPHTIRADVERFLELSRAYRNDVLPAELLAYVASPYRDKILVASGQATASAPAGEAPSGPYRPVVPVPVHTNGGAPSLAGARSANGANGNGHADGAARPGVATRQGSGRNGDPLFEAEPSERSPRFVVPPPVPAGVPAGDPETTSDRRRPDPTELN